jgi:hypothetical protein
MEFKLTCGDDSYSFQGDAAYRFDRHGLLVVTDGEGRQFTYSPSAWSLIEEPEHGSANFGM